MGQSNPPTTYCPGIEPDEIREIGEQWTDKGACHLKTCLEEGETWIDECDELPEKLPDPRCVIIPADCTKKYPDCCPRMECPSQYQISAEHRDDAANLLSHTMFRVNRSEEIMMDMIREDEAEQNERYKKKIMMRLRFKRKKRLKMLKIGKRKLLKRY